MRAAYATAGAYVAGVALLVGLVVWGAGLGSTWDPALEAEKAAVELAPATVTANGKVCYR